MATQECLNLGHFAGSGIVKHWEGGDTVRFVRCKNCGKEFNLTKDRKKCPSCKCNEVEDVYRVCEFCGESFIPEGRNASRQKYCKRIHYRVCECCGIRFQVVDVTMPNTACSTECANKLKIEKARRTVSEKYGVSNISQSSEFKERISKGIQNAQPHIIENRKKTMIDRYGQDSPMKVPEIREKIFKTNEMKYGHRNPSKNMEVRHKISEALSSEEVLERYRQNSLVKWGVPRPSMLPEIQDKMKATCMEKYGKPFAIQSDIVKFRMITSLEQYRLNHPESFGRQDSGNMISKINKDFGHLLCHIENKITYELRIENRFYDIALPDRKILIEIDPTYTHNAVGNHWGDGLDPNYHIEKSQLAEKYGYRCIHIFDWDDWDKILNMLTPNKRRLFARNLDIRDIDKKTADEFIDKYHLQGKCRGNVVNLGLFNRDKLIQVMTFGKPRYNKKYEGELLRLCTRSDCYVVGGAEKLFIHFIRNFNPESIISYCDRSKFSGEVYERLGMKLINSTQPAKVWSSGNDKITDNLLRQRGFDQLFDAHFGKGTSNEELMLQHGWLPVYDCGQNAYSWNR